MATLVHNASDQDEGTILTKAVFQAAQRLGINGGELAEIIGVSPSTVTRIKNQNYVLSPDSKSWELGILFVRLYRALDAITGGDETSARAWIRNTNEHLHSPPIDLLKKVDGLSRTLAYVDAYRAPV